MEFTSEIAVLQSAFRFAASKFGNPTDKTDLTEVENFTNLIASAIEEIVDGLEESRTLLDRNVWSFKLTSFLFTHILKDVFSEEQRRSGEEQRCLGNEEPCHTDGGSVNEHKPQLGLMSPCTDTVFQHIPCLSYPIFLELVKRFNWNGHLLECLEVIDETKTITLISATLDTVNKWPTGVESLEIVVTCLKYLLWLIVQSANQKYRLQSDVTATIAAVLKWLSNSFEKLDWNEGLVKKPGLIIDLSHLLVILCHIFLKEISNSDLRSILTNSCVKKEVYPAEEEVTKVLTKLAARQHRTQDEGSFEVQLEQLQKSYTRSDWLLVMSAFLQCSVKEGSGCESVEDLFCADLAAQMTLHLGLVDINMEDVYTSLSNSLNKQRSRSSEDDRMSVLMRFLKSVESECHDLKLLKEKEEEERKGQITLHEMLYKRLPGYEDCVDKLLSCCDISTWESERYVNLLTENSDLLFRESHVRCLLCTLKAFVKAKGRGQTLPAVKKVLLNTFSKLPILSQEKIIHDNFLSENDPALLACIGNFNQDMNVTFNQFTSEASEKQLLAVLRLCLVDPMAVVEHAVSTAVKSPGQIPVVLKIFHSVPDLCRCSYGNHHPERSLLCHVTSQYLLENALTHNEAKNLLKFVSATIQSFTREVCGYRLSESAILSAAEFASAAVLPFIGLHKSADQNQPISVEFALKLLICILEKKGDKNFDWLIGLQPQTILLCLCELLHECVSLWETADHKNGIKLLCLKCLHLMQTKFGGIFSHLHGKAVDWLKSRTKDLDWSVLIHLQKTLHFLGGSQGTDYSMLVENLAQHAVKQSEWDESVHGDSCLPLLRFVSVTDETLEAAKQCLQACNRVISPDVLASSLAEILPNLLLSEWSRVSDCLMSLVQCDLLAVQYTLMFENRIILATNNDVKCLLSLTQLLTDVVITTLSDLSAPVSAVRHVASCYIAVLQEQTKILNELKDRSTKLFLICQMFSHVTVAMMTMDVDQSEPLFVFLLNLLERYVDLQNRRVPRGKGRESVSPGGEFRASDENIVKAVALLDDEGRQETLLKKLFEKRREN